MHLFASSYSAIKVLVCFMSCLAVVIVTHLLQFFASTMIVLLLIYLSITIFSICLPCQTSKKGYCHRLIDKNGIHLVWWYSIALVRLRCLIQWQILSKGLYATVLVFYFIEKYKQWSCAPCFKLISATYYWRVTVGTFRAVLLPVHSPTHAVCVLIYFSLADTAANYFSPRRSCPIWNWLCNTFQVATLIVCYEFKYDKMYCLSLILI